MSNVNFLLTTVEKVPRRHSENPQRGQKTIEDATPRQNLANRLALLNFALPKLVVLKDMRCTSRTSHSCHQFLLRTPPLPPRPKPCFTFPLSQCHCRHLFFLQKPDLRPRNKFADIKHALNVAGSDLPLPISLIPLGCKDQKVQQHVNIHAREVNTREIHQESKIQ